MYADDGVLANDTDEDGDTLSVEIVASPAHGSVVLNSNGQTVVAVNDAPVAEDDAYEVDENTTLTVDASNGVLANDTDADEDALTVDLVSAPSYGTLSLESDGSFTYTPNTDFTGEDSFVYEVTDGEDLVIVDANDAVIASCTYDDEGDWPTEADGEGYTLERISLDDADDPANWSIGDEGGSPGTVPDWGTLVATVLADETT